MSTIDNNINLPTFHVQVLAFQAEPQPLDRDDFDDEAVAGDNDGTGATPDTPAPPRPSLDELARQVHAEFTKLGAKLDYEPFEDEWLAAAKLAQELECDIETFVEAQRQRGIRLDPEDIGGAAARDAYERFIRDRDHDIVRGFVYSGRLLETSVDMDAGRTPHAQLWSPMMSYHPAYRVLASQRLCTWVEHCEIVAFWHREAARELRLSSSLRQYLVDHRWFSDLNEVSAYQDWLDLNGPKFQAIFEETAAVGRRLQRDGGAA